MGVEARIMFTSCTCLKCHVRFLLTSLSFGSPGGSEGDGDGRNVS